MLWTYRQGQKGLLSMPQQAQPSLDGTVDMSCCRHSTVIVVSSWYLAHSIASVGGLDAYSRLVQGRAFVRHGI